MDDIQQETVASKPHDWTNVYKKFENFKDEDDEDDQKKKKVKPRDMNPMAGCNHDHSAERAIQ